MSNQATENLVRAIADPSLLRASPEFDDDDDAADWDDDDEDMAAGQAPWFSRAGFGSPEWWNV